MHASHAPQRCRRLAILVFVPLSLTLPAGVFAAWEIVPDMGLSAEANDNILLDSQNEQSAQRAALDAAVRFSSFGQRGNLYIEPRFTTDTYSDSEAKVLESDDVFFDAGGQYGWRIVGVGFRSAYSDELVLRSELVDAAPDDPDTDPGDDFTDPDTGRLTSVSERQEKLNMRGNLDFQISERNVLRLEAATQEVDYTGAGGASTGRSDFDDNSLTMAIRRRVDERNSLSATMRIEEYHADKQDNTTDSVRMEGTFTRPLAPNWSMTLSAGVQRSEYNLLRNGQRVDNAVATELFSLGFTKRAERMRWTIDLGHRVQPNANGYLAVRDELRAYTTRDFSPRLTGQFGVRLSRTETLDDVNTSDNRDYSRIELGFSWAFRESLFLDFGAYRYTQEFVEESSVEATSNAVFFGLTYRGRSRQNQ